MTATGCTEHVVCLAFPCKVEQIFPCKPLRPIAGHSLGHSGRSAHSHIMYSLISAQNWKLHVRVITNGPFCQHVVSSSVECWPPAPFNHPDHDGFLEFFVTQTFKCKSDVLYYIGGSSSSNNTNSNNDNHAATRGQTWRKTTKSSA